MDITELQRLEAGKLINRHPWEKTRADIISFFLSRHKPVSNHIADIGSGDAYVLGTLAGKGHARQYSAIDLAYTPAIIDQLRQGNDQSQIDFYTASSELENKGQKADCFLLLDVLEHCEDDKAVLQSLTASRFVAESALFIISAPAFKGLFSKHDKLLNHFRRYNRKSLRSLANSAGLEILESGYFFHTLLPVRIFQVLLEKAGLRNPTSSLDSWKGNKTITSAFYAILWIDFRVGYFFSRIGLRFPGLSSYCICRKLPS